MIEVRNFLCVSCPVGCALSVTAEGTEAISVEGNSCPLGEKYARDEIRNPVRMFTSIVRVAGGFLPVCPVRGGGPLPLHAIIDAAKETAGVCVNAPVEIGQLIISDILGSGVDIIATRSVRRKS